MIDDAKTVAILAGGDGCRDARDEVLQLAEKLKAPIGYSFRGKQWLEHDNPNAVGMTGLPRLRWSLQRKSSRRPPADARYWTSPSRSFFLAIA